MLCDSVVPVWDESVKLRVQSNINTVVTFVPPKKLLICEIVQDIPALDSERCICTITKVDLVTL